MDREMHDATMGTDYFRIWRGLDKLVEENSLHWRADYTRMQIVQAEVAAQFGARSDFTTTDNDSTTDVPAPVNSAFNQPLTRALYHLTRAVGDFEQAGADIQHLFRGKLRARTEGKIRRQAEAARALLAQFQAVRDELNAVDMPHKGKVEVMDNLTLTFNDYLTVIGRIRRSLRGDKYCQPLTDNMLAQEGRIRALRKTVAECRKAPTEYMRDTFSAITAECQDIDRQLKEIVRGSLQQCLDHGLIVFKGNVRLLKA